jgi:site-specific DNA-methyltransferase (adenine-specific)
MSNALMHADCLDALGRLPEASVQLIYLDPPFNTRVRRNAAAGTYDDALGRADQYIAYMRARVEQMRRVLTAHGSLFFHCDWRMSHHVKLMLDAVFEVGGAGRRKKTAGVFVNEIIWRYGLGAARVGRQLLTKHDTIFWYARSSDYTFNPLRGEPTKAMLAKYCHIEPDGRRYMMSYGKRYYMKGGKPLDDVWDIPAIAATSGERAGYPTQKPLALLERVIALASNPGDTVLDPFCGSGTTLVAAQKHARQWIGIDASAQAIAVAKSRLLTNRT